MDETTADVRCPSCGAAPPLARLLADGGIFCRPEGRVTGGAYREVPQPRGWYAMRDEPLKQQYWDGRQWTGRPRKIERTTRPFPPPERVMLEEGTKGAEPPSRPPVTRFHEDGTKTCPQCAEHVQAAALVCRFCGHRFDGKAPSVALGEISTSGVAVAAFICSLLGLWIAAIPLGVHAQHQIDESGGRKTGRGFATAGVVLGILGIIGTIILIIVLVSAAKHAPSCTYTYNSTGTCVPE